MSCRLSLWLLLCFPSLLSGGEIALSFDDAPKRGSTYLTGSERTAMLLAKLAQLGIGEVVFYCNTSKLDDDDGAARLKRYAEAGHLLATTATATGASRVSGLRPISRISRWRTASCAG